MGSPDARATHISTRIDIFKMMLRNKDTQAWAIGLLLITISLSFTASFIHPFVTVKHVILRLGIGLLLLLIPIRFRLLSQQCRDMLLLFWFIWLGMSSLMDTPWPQSGFKLEGLVLLVLFYLMVRTTLSNRNYLNTIIFIIAVVATIQSCIGVLQYFKLFPWTSVYFLGFETQVTGTVEGANVLGALLAASLPSVYFLISKSIKWGKTWWVIALILIVATLILTKSRGAWVAVLVGLGIYNRDDIIKSLHRLRPHKIILSFLVFVAFGVITLFLVKIYNLNPDSADGRLFIWSVTKAMISDHIWTGVGYGNFGLNWLEYQGAYFTNAAESTYRLAVSLTSAHSQYLQILAETGVVGFTLFVVFLVSLPYSLIQRFRNHNREQQQTIITLFAMLATLLTHALVEDVFSSLTVQLLFLLILAAFVSGTDYEKGSAMITRDRFRGWKPLVLFPLLFLLVAVSYRQVKGELLWKQGQNFARSGSWDQSITHYQEAMVYLPFNHELDFYLGAAYSKIGQAEKAINYLKKSQEGFSDKNQNIALGKAYIDNGNYGRAESTLNQVLYYYPALLSPHYWLSRAYFEQEYFERTRQELKIILSAKNILHSSDIERVKDDARSALAAITATSQK